MLVRVHLESVYGVPGLLQEIRDTGYEQAILVG